MITQNDIQRLGLPNIEAYYQQIVQSRQECHEPQGKRMIKRLSQPQKKAFLEWIDGSFDENGNPDDEYRRLYAEYAYYTMIILS